MKNTIEPELLNVQKAGAFLGVNPGTIRRWAKTGMLSGIKVGTRGDWRFKEEALLKLTIIPSVKKEQKKFTKIKKLLSDNADVIQKLATLHHANLIGSDPLPEKKIDKYNKVHIKIIKALAYYLDDFEKGINAFKKLGEELAKEAVKDGLTIEEAVYGTIFQKQAIWKKLEDTGILKEMSTQDLYEFSQTIGKYCDVLASKTAFTYHNYFTEKVARSEDKYHALIEKSSDAIALVNPNGKVVYASHATKVLMGYSSEEFQQLNNPFELVPPDDRKVVTKLFKKLLKNPGSTENVVYRVLHKNGTHIWIESAMTNLLKDPNVKAIVLNYRDITERIKLESQKDDFISIATHELKTPVTSIKGYTQVLKSRFGKEGNEQAVIMLSKMDVQLKKLTNLIGDLLDVTKVDGGKLLFHEGIFNFNELVVDIIDEMQLTTTKHHLIKNLATKKAIHGDRDRIGQVLINLLSNAIKYSPHNKKIIITTAESKQDVTVYVQDFGIGIPKEQQGKIFERFFRAGDAEDTFAGLGLGLFISTEIVKRHDGRIWVESTEGGGSTFYFSLPIKANKDRKNKINTLVKEEMAHE